MNLSAQQNTRITPQLAAQLEFAERDMWKSVWSAVPPALALELGVHLEQRGPAVSLMLEAIPDWLFNRTIGLGMGSAATVDDLHYLMDLYANKRLPLGISLSPLAEPAQLRTQLEEAGFGHVMDWAKMIRGTEAPPQINTDLRLEAISPEQYALAGDVICTGFGVTSVLQPMFTAALEDPANHGYMMWEGNNPAAAAILTVRDGVGHLNTACTLPEYQRRGAQGALMAHRIRQGIAMGCTLFVTETGLAENQHNTSLQNMLRCGFELAYARPNLVLPAP